MQKAKLLVLALSCCMAMEMSAQEQKKLPQQIVKQRVLSQQRKVTAKQVFLKAGEVLPVKGAIIPQGTELTVEVEWDAQRYKKIVYDTSVYKPTPEEIKNCKYTFKVKPQKTTTYTSVSYYHDGRVISFSRTITVVDKNGKEIKEENKK